MINNKCKVISNKEIAPSIFEMIIEDSDISIEAKPGQFLHIKVKLRSDTLLRRPISICDIDNNNITIVYQVVGKGTKELSLVKPLEFIDVIGPIGNAYPIDNSKRCAIIGGGIGIAPLLGLSKRLKNCDAYLGFKSDVYKVDDFNRSCDNVIISTEDGSFGSKGYITDFISAIESYDIIYTCGPKVMMKMVKEMCHVLPSITCYLSMEERMGCGIGACLVCTCKTTNVGDSKWHYKKVCTDGPVFNAEEVELND